MTCALGRAWGRTFFSQKSDVFLNEPLVLGSFAAWGRFFSKHYFVLNKPRVPGSFAAWGRTVSRNMTYFSRSHLSRATSLPGAEPFLIFFEQATCPRQLRCLGQNFFSKLGLFFEQTTCPGQLRCLGQNFFLKLGRFFLNKPLVPGSFAAWGGTFS